MTMLGRDRGFYLASQKLMITIDRQDIALEAY